jgi:hypothetical protein
MVYIVRHGVDEFFKVGHTSRSISSRIAELQAGTPHEITLCARLDGDKDIETAIHASLAEYHIRGEWFEVPESELIGVLRDVTDKLDRGDSLRLTSGFGVKERNGRAAGGKKASYGKSCPVCGNLLTIRQSYCSSVCRQRAYRQRKQSKENEK